MLHRTYKTFPNRTGSFIFSDAAEWGQIIFDTCCLLDSHYYNQDPYGSFEKLLAIGIAAEINGGSQDDFSALAGFSERSKDWLFGFLSYDLKNQLENLYSANHDALQFPLMHFFRPVILVMAAQEDIIIGCLPGYGKFSEPENVFQMIRAFRNPPALQNRVPEIKARVSRARYLQKVNAIKQHIQAGDIYEMNYCIEFFSENSEIDTINTYRRLTEISPTPFSAYYKLKDNYLICSSPERFLKNKAGLLVSQPIKGTAPRGKTPEEDLRLNRQLYFDEKERSENVMIVDLVRNDLSKVAQKGSVKVEELFGIYSFPTVHQMISTVTAKLSDNRHFTDALRFAFPMGSMTGAPKIRAMQLIEIYEDTKRGLFSGAVGYISPESDFDFNVVIRSILYNSRNKYLAFLAGSAITSGSVPENEYLECLHKANTMKNALKQN
jgi:para-aminobenzoate synthetase component I